MRKIRFILLVFIEITISVCAFGQNKQGFFLNDFHPKSFVIPPFRNVKPTRHKASVSVDIYFKDTLATVSKYVFGNNSNVYMTQMVNQPRLLHYIKELSPNVIRYPGGNISNLFFWNAKRGEKPADVPDTILYGDNRPVRPSRFWYGRDNSPRAMSVDHYYEMLKETGSTGIICVNNGYARYGIGPHPVETAAHLAADWVRYDNGRTKYWEIGNEDYGPWEAGYIIDTTKNQDGQPFITTGELYGKHFKIFADSMRAAARQIGVKIEIGAVLEELPKKHTRIMHNWNLLFFKTAGNAADFFIIHSYYTPYEQDSPPSVILNSAQIETQKMMNYMQKMVHDFGVEQKPVALTEWNIFATGSKQDCSYINGIHAALVLGALIRNHYGLACRWDLANRYNNGNDMGTFNRGDKPGLPKWNPYPVFFYMYYFQKYFGDHMVKAAMSDTSIVAYASTFHSGQAGIIVINKSAETEYVQLGLKEFKSGRRYYMYRLTGSDDNPPFSQQVYVNGVAPDYTTGGPAKELSHIKALSSTLKNNAFIFKAPGYSVQYIAVDNRN